MKKETTVQEAFSRLSALCARGEHCQHDMLEKMRQWGMDDESKAQVMEKLVGGRFVDDERFARAFVSDKIHYAKWGRRKIEQALRMKRIDDSIIDDILGAIDDTDYLDVLRPLIKQKLKSTRAASDYELRMKVMRFAMSRGFTADIIRQCLDISDIADEE